MFHLSCSIEMLAHTSSPWPASLVFGFAYDSETVRVELVFASHLESSNMDTTTVTTTAQERIETLTKVKKFITIWRAAGFNNTDSLIEPFPEEPVDENGEPIQLTLQDLDVLVDSILRRS